MGVNLLPYIDRARLVKAMNEADGNESKLTEHERERNKRNGDIKLFFRPNIHNKNSALLKALKENPTSELHCESTFKIKDTIVGKIDFV